MGPTDLVGVDAAQHVPPPVHGPRPGLAKAADSNRVSEAPTEPSGLVGRRFERLVVVQKLWGGRCVVRCDCGTTKEAAVSNLYNGSIKSCGCLRRDVRSGAVPYHVEDRHPSLAGDPGISREQRRSRRKRAVRAITVSMKRMTKREFETGRMLYAERGYWKPRTRADCVDGPRPCPYVSCKHHLYLDVSGSTGAIKLNYPDLEVEELEETCALDVADRLGTTLEDVGALMNLTRERIRQVEVRALEKLERLRAVQLLGLDIERGSEGKRRLPITQTEDIDAEEHVELDAYGDPMDDVDDDPPISETHPTLEVE